MGNKISVRTGIKSPNIYHPGNARNEIWIGNLEIISRLPFGDSDIAQAGWPKGDYPKVPWRPFIIPLRAVVSKTAKSLPAVSSSLSRRSFIPPSTSEMLDTVTDAANPWVILLFLSVPLLLGPIIIYHVPQAYSKRCHQPACSHLVAPDLECGDAERHGRKRRHLAVGHAICAQSLGDAGLCLMFVAIQFMNGKLCSPDGEHKVLATFLQTCIMLLATLSRAYLLRIWWKYVKGYCYLGAEDCGLQTVQRDYYPDSEKAQLVRSGL
ncbi:hypothetical protein VTO42DRAFT_5982 [Malbranchea cinnamomea]